MVDNIKMNFNNIPLYIKNLHSFPTSNTKYREKLINKHMDTSN